MASICRETTCQEEESPPLTWDPMTDLVDSSFRLLQARFRIRKHYYQALHWGGTEAFLSGPQLFGGQF